MVKAKEGDGVAETPQQVGQAQPAQTSNTLSLKSLGLFFGGLVIGVALGWLLFGMSNSGGNAVANGNAGNQAQPGVVQGTGQAGSTAGAPSTNINTITGDTQPVKAPLPVPVYKVASKMGTMPWENLHDYLTYMQANTKETVEHLTARYRLAEKYIESKELQGNAIEGFLRTPREDFVRDFNMSKAYADSWLPIGYGATITDPDVVSMMTTTLDVQPNHRVLEIGTGSGYQSGILSNLSDYVFSIEIIEPLQKETDELYNKLANDYPQYKNIHRKLGDGYYGWEEYGPFDRIIVTCAIDHLPPPLLRQLSPGGIMVVPLGPPGRQHIMEVKKTVDEQGNEVLKRRDVYNGLQVKFIPFRDEKGSSYSGKEGS